jgi:hypothetical protein
VQVVDSALKIMHPAHHVEIAAAGPRSSEVENESGEARQAEPVGQIRVTFVARVRRFAGGYAVADADGRRFGCNFRETQLPDNDYVIDFPVDWSYFHHLVPN